MIIIVDSLFHSAILGTYQATLTNQKAKIMKTYLYQVLENSSKRGFNRTIIVYRVKHNRPYRIAFNEDIQTKAYKGDRMTAIDMISSVDGGDTYAKIKNNKVSLFEI